MKRQEERLSFGYRIKVFFSVKFKFSILGTICRLTIDINVIPIRAE